MTRQQESCEPCDLTLALACFITPNQSSKEMTFKHMENNSYCHFNVRNLAAEMRFECLFLCCFLVFSVITMSLRPQTQGNIWLFDDTVLITRKASGMSDKTSLLPIILFNYPYCYFYIENRFKNLIIYNLMQYLYTVDLLHGALLGM